MFRRRSHARSWRVQIEGPERVPLGVLFVHGMGSAVQGATLRQHGEPLVDWLADGTDLFARAELLDVELTPGDGQAAHLTCQLFASENPAQREPLTSWILAESHWAQTFRAATYIRIVVWLIGSVPWMIGENFRASLWRQQTRRSGRFSAVRWLLYLFYELGWTVLTGPIIIVLALLLPAQYWPSKRIRAWSGKVPRALAASLGDVYVILATHVDREAIRARIVRDYEWLQSQCVDTVVVAHSAGSALTHGLIRDERIKKVKVFATLGEAIWRMEWMCELSKPENGTKRLGALTLALMGFSFSVAAIVSLVEQQWWLTVLFGVVSVAANMLSTALVWRDQDAGTVRRRVKDDLVAGPAPKVQRWRDWVASSDPVPGGMLTDAPTVARSKSEPDEESSSIRRYDPVWIRNKRSTLLDHVTYPDNLEEYIANLGIELAQADSTLARCPALVSTEVMEKAAKARSFRTLSMSMARAGSGLFSLFLLMLLWHDELLGQVGSHFEWAATLLRKTTHKILGHHALGHPVAKELAGLAASLIVIAAAWFMISAGWKRWDRVDRRNFMLREPRLYVETSSSTSQSSSAEGDRATPAFVRSTAIDAAYATWWLIWTTGAGLLVLTLARHSLWWWPGLVTLSVGMVPILFVRTLAAWCDRAFVEPPTRDRPKRNRRRVLRFRRTRPAHGPATRQPTVNRTPPPPTRDGGAEP